MRLFIGNAFSLSMLDRAVQTAGPAGKIINGRMVQARTPRPVTNPRDILECADEVHSVLGHASTQKLFEKELGIPVPVQRVNLKLRQGELLLVGQYIGPRLPEGATELPEGATLEWWIV